MKRIIILSVLFVLAIANARAQAPELPTAITGRVHVLLFDVEGQTIGLPVITRGAEPLVTPEPPHTLNPKCALLLPTSEEDFDLFVRVLKGSGVTKYPSVSTAGIPNLPPSATCKAACGTTPVRVLAKLHKGPHGRIKSTHYDLVSYYPMPPLGE